MNDKTEFEEWLKEHEKYLLYRTIDDKIEICEVAYKAGQASREDRWVSPHDEVPDEFVETVLCQFSDGVIETYSAKYIGLEDLFVHNVSIVYWQYLPEPKEEKQNDN